MKAGKKKSIQHEKFNMVLDFSFLTEIMYYIRHY